MASRRKVAKFYRVWYSHLFMLGKVGIRRVTDLVLIGGPVTGVCRVAIDVFPSEGD